MRPEGITVEKKGPLAMVVLRRPGRLNAFNQTMFAEMEDAVRELSNTPLPEAVIVQSNLGRPFMNRMQISPTMID